MWSIFAAFFFFLILLESSLSIVIYKWVFLCYPPFHSFCNLKSEGSPINVLFCVGEVQETIVVLIFAIDFVEARIWLQHVLLVGKKDKSLFTCQVKSLAQDSQNFTNSESFGHHESEGDIKKRNLLLEGLCFRNRERKFNK